MPAYAPSVPKERQGVNECGVHTMLAMRMMYSLRKKEFLRDRNGGEPWFTKDFRKVCGYGAKEVIEFRKAAEVFIRRFSDYQKEVEAHAVTGYESDESDESGVLEVWQ